MGGQRSRQLQRRRGREDGEGDEERSSRGMQETVETEDALLSRQYKV